SSTSSKKVEGMAVVGYAEVLAPGVSGGISGVATCGTSKRITGGGGTTVEALPGMPARRLSSSSALTTPKFPGPQLWLALCPLTYPQS
ncbi:unnamed protein product, partial [Ilex paraguariensis]